jgi:hypothetical protein
MLRGLRPHSLRNTPRLPRPPGPAPPTAPNTTLFGVAIWWPIRTLDPEGQVCRVREALPSHSAHTPTRPRVRVHAARTGRCAHMLVSWQYPGEKEITFPPYTCLESDGDPRVERNDQGEIVIFPLKVPRCLTFEENVRKRFRFHIGCEL